MNRSPIRCLAIACTLLMTMQEFATAAPPDLSTSQLTTFQATDGSVLDEPTLIDGSTSTLTRKNNKIAIDLTTFDLPAGVYTFWWHLSNQGSGPEDDSILFATSTIVGDNGTAEVTATLKEGQNPGFVFTGNGLLDARNADVELFVRWHGAPSDDPDTLVLQLTHPFGGCIHELNPAPSENDVVCYNPQIAVHLAGN